MSCTDNTCGTGGWSGPLPGDPNNNSILSATGVYGGIAVSWTYPTTNPFAVAHTKVFRGYTESFVNAVEHRIISGNYFLDELGADNPVRYYYWIQVVSANGTVNEPIGPASAVSLAYSEKLLQELSGKINVNLLDAALRTEVERIDLVNLGLSQEVADRFAANTVLSNALDAVQADTDAAITFAISKVDEQRTATEAVATAVDALGASVVPGISALTQRVTAAETSIEGKASASDVTTLSSTVGDHTTSIQTATNSINGIQGKYTVKVDNNGYISGFGLISDSNNGTPSSAFIVRADNFKVVMPGYGNYSPFSIGDSNVTFNGNTTWSGVTGTGKPLDNSGKVIDLGAGTAAGQRGANDPPSFYPTGKSLQFKQASALGVAGSTYITVETNRPYGDSSGGVTTQWAYGDNGATWKRYANNAAASWSAWTQDLDRNTYTGALNATYGADASNLNVGLGVNLLPNTEFSGGNFSPAILGWNPGVTEPLSLRGDDEWRLRGAQCLQVRQPARTGNADNVGADVYLTGAHGDYHYGIPVSGGKRYELSAKLASHRANSTLTIPFFDSSGVHVGEVSSGWVARTTGGPSITANASGSGWMHAVTFGVAPATAAYASPYWRTSDTDGPPAEDSYCWLTQPFFGEALASQVGPSTYSPGYAKGAFSAVDKLTAGNIATFMDNAVIGAAQIGSIALVGTSNFSVKSATAGARTEMDSRVIKVFDASGVLRVKLGDLSA